MAGSAAAGDGRPGHRAHASPAELAHLSGAMADAGLALQDPDLLIAAARLRLSLPAAAGPDAVLARSALTWLEAAGHMAPGNRQIAARIEDVRGLRTRGRAPGPMSVTVRLDRNGQASLSEPFRGSRAAIVFAETDNGRPVRLLVENQAGETVCQDASRQPRAICRWLPPAGRTFTIRLDAAGATRVVVITN